MGSQKNASGVRLQDSSAHECRVAVEMRGVFSAIQGIIRNRYPYTISLCDCLLPYVIVAEMDRWAIGGVGNPEIATAAESDFKVEIRGFRGLIPF